jgi:CubicO group peptidase (beta-lactamase class C family)
MNLVTPESVGLDSGRLARIGRHLRQRYVEPGKIPGCLTLVARRGQVCYLDVSGHRDLQRDAPLTEDTVFRIYSMTKPITSVAVMTLFERGLIALDDPVHRFIPAWRDLQVRTAGSFPQFEGRPCARPMTVRDLLTHTSGLTYDWLRETNVDYAYRKLQVGVPNPGYTLERMVEQLAGLPLEFDPGSRWAYSVATDVLGYLVQVISGRAFPDYLREEIFEPLGMVDTGFTVSEAQRPRFASCYVRGPDKTLALQDDGQDSAYRERSFFSGGGGLVSTAADYLRFCQMLLNGGALGDARILGPRTLALMTRNHLPGGADLRQYGVGSFAESGYDGVGFGLGFARLQDPVLAGTTASEGSYYWGGLASTLFWVDPAEELAVVFMTQLIPSGTFNFRGQLEAIVYGSFID